MENIGTSTLIWKKENRIISAGQVIIRKVSYYVVCRKAMQVIIRKVSYYVVFRKAMQVIIPPGWDMSSFARLYTVQVIIG